MKTLTLAILSLFFAISQILATELNLTQEESAWLKKHPTLKVQALDSFPPFNFVDANKQVGYTVDYMRLVGKYLDVKMEFSKATSFGEGMEMFRRGEIDILPHIAVSKKRDSYIDYTNFEHIKYSIGFTMRRGENIFDMRDLNDKTIAVLNNSFILNYIKKNFPKLKTVLVPSTKEGIFAITLKKADVFVGSIPTMNYYIQKNWLANLETTHIKGFGLEDSISMPMGVHEGETLLKSILEKVNFAVPHSEIIALKKRWLNMNSQNKDVLSLTNEESDYLSKKSKIKMCVLPNWLPFEQIDEYGVHRGIGADIVKIISEKIDKDIVLVPTKVWADSLQNIRDRVCDILPVAMDIPSRRDAMDFTKPYTKEPFVIATKNDQFFIKDSRDIGKRKVGIVKSYAFIEVLKLRNPKVQIIEVTNAYEGLKRVQSGELFGYIDIMSAVGYTIQKHAMFDLKVAGKLEFDIELSIASRNDEPLLNSIMQKSLDSIGPEKIRTLVKKWIEIKVQQEFDYTKLFYIIAIFTAILSVILYKNYSIRRINYQLSLANDEIKEQQKITESLTQYQKSLLTLFDKGDAVLFKWSLDGDMSVEYVSLTVEKLTGYLPKEFLDKKIKYENLIDSDDLSSVQEKIKEGIDSNLEYFKHEPYRINTKDGKQKWVLDYVVTLKDSENSITHLLIYISDITEHMKQQETLFQQAKMASIGEMIGNISHQWRQPLSLISSVATGTKLKKEYGILEDNELEENMSIINTNTQYLSKTIDDFRNFIKGKREFVKFNLSENIDYFLNLVNPSVVNYRIKIVKDCDSDIVIEGYPNELIQAFINIYNNAKDALLLRVEEDRYFFIDGKKEQKSVVIIFKDSGGGIPQEVINRVFEPYITTKHQSQGTGLGLNITYNFIVSGMRGSINVKNSSFLYEGKKYSGAEFKIELPLTFS